MFLIYGKNFIEMVSIWAILDKSSKYIFIEKEGSHHELRKNEEKHFKCR